MAILLIALHLVDVIELAGIEGQVGPSSRRGSSDLE
jgi:hypothetical protein